ncbi:hypothetical protein PR048_023581 [Dryococelus australis]|uniref:Uncharacterized protein n=1 Tax=Dryococelus australis TaxID=614101 RepID=A0ABQ9GUH3_9NEOP|nr:hypothetical protein PR048_023581 [Dryococelus australis]
MLIIQNGCVIREYRLKFLLLYDLRGLCAIEIQNYIGTVTEVVLFFRHIFTRVKFDGLSVEIHCFLFNKLRNYYKITKSSFAPHYNALRNEVTPKFIIIFAAIKWVLENFEITISEKKVQCSNYATAEDDDQIFHKNDFIETLKMWDNIFSPCSHIYDLQHQVRGIFPHYVKLNHICSTVCQKTTWMG